MKIREKDKNTIISIAKETLKKPSEIIAFGSRVSGDSHDTSDLDLVIVSKDKNKVDIDEFMEFKKKLQKSNIPIVIQVLDWYRIPESFHSNINLNKELLVEV